MFVSLFILSLLRIRELSVCYFTSAVKIHMNILSNSYAGINGCVYDLYTAGDATFSELEYKLNLVICRNISDKNVSITFLLSSGAHPVCSMHQIVRRLQTRFPGFARASGLPQFHCIIDAPLEYKTSTSATCP